MKKNVILVISIAIAALSCVKEGNTSIIKDIPEGYKSVVFQVMATKTTILAFVSN